MWLGDTAGGSAGVECQEENHGEHRIFHFGILEHISWGGLNMGYNLGI